MARYENTISLIKTSSCSWIWNILLENVYAICQFKLLETYMRYVSSNMFFIFSDVSFMTRLEFSLDYPTVQVH